MTSKEAIKLAYIEFQKDFENGEETNQWLTNVIDGLKQAEKDLEILEQYKKIEEELGISLIEAKYVIDNANMTVGYTHSGKPVHTDYGYIEDFITELREALENDR